MIILAAAINEHVETGYANNQSLLVIRLIDFGDGARGHRLLSPHNYVSSFF